MEMDQESQQFRRITMKVLTMQLNSTSVMDIAVYGGAAVGMIFACSEYLAGTLFLSGALTIIFLASEFFIPLRLLGSFFHIAMNGMAASDKIFALLDLEEPKQGARELPDGALDFNGVVICTAAMMGSFGPVVALANLSNNLNQTLACEERVLSILEEEPEVEEIPETAENRKKAKAEHPFGGAAADHVTFAYQDEKILEDYSVRLEPGKITGIHGLSGCGKSTLLKLLMRFWDADQGKVEVDGRDVRKIPTAQLRQIEGYVTQETYLFHDSIASNIRIGKPDATREEVEAAARSASIHEWIMKLPNGYETGVGELGDTLSGGEKQRIGIARAFLHDAPLLLMDEPTSNLDSLNEGIILKSLQKIGKEKTVVLVSHRESTMAVADRIVRMNRGKS